MNIEFLESAQYELDDAVAYYNHQRDDLGSEFLSEFVDSLSRIAEYPNAWQQLTERTRRCLIHRFPYGIIYQNRNDVILVVAVSSLHRKPEYWQNRIQNL